MTDDIIILVPPGTRVRYIENPYTDGKVFVADAHALRPTIDVRPRFDFGGQVGDLLGLPIYDAERYEDP